MEGTDVACTLQQLLCIRRVFSTLMHESPATASATIASEPLPLVPCAAAILFILGIGLYPLARVKQHLRSGTIFPAITRWSDFMT